MQQISTHRDLSRMAPVAILVICLHLALLTIPVRSARPDRALAEGGQVHVRLLSAPFAQGHTAPLPGPPSRDAVEEPLPVEGLPPKPVADPAPPPAAAATLSPPGPAFGLVAPGADRDGDYFPRALLSLAPIPLDTVVIDYPPIDKDSGHHVSELTLFID